MAYYKDGTISIPNVTGDIVITASAVPTAFVPIEIYDPSKARLNLKWSGTSEVAGDGYFFTHIVDVDVSQTPYLHVMGAKYGGSGARAIYKIGSFNGSSIPNVDYETSFSDTHTDNNDQDFYIDLRTSTTLGANPTRICVSMFWSYEAMTEAPTSEELRLTLCQEIPA